ncbi:hypothetical protein LY78DRAFT_236376 [Colletotrichum sublineola]|nr:hypothetical protein LY78DRAFT_236376 [Colletotrichum sublineola]
MVYDATMVSCLASPIKVCAKIIPTKKRSFVSLHHFASSLAASSFSSFIFATCMVSEEDRTNKMRMPSCELRLWS